MIPQSLYERVATFLHQYLPYSEIPMSEIIKWVPGMSMGYFSAKEYVFQEGEAVKDHVFIIYKGKIEINQLQQGTYQLVDVCDIGDSIGVRAVLSHQSYQFSAVVAEDALVYMIPSALFIRQLERFPTLSMFFASGFASGKRVVKSGSVGLVQKGLFPTGKKSHADEVIHSLTVVREVLTCTADQTLHYAAQKMAEWQVGSIIIINEKGHPMGIITDTDFTRKITAQKVPVDEFVSNYMSSPVIAVSQDITIALAIIMMIRHNIRHLIITQDGTPHTQVTGIISEHDLVSRESNSPTLLVNQLIKAEHKEQLRELRDQADGLIQRYFEQEYAVTFIAEVITHINDILIRRSIQLAERLLKDVQVVYPGLTYGWLSLGSEGRAEQLLRSDQDNGIIYQDPPEELKPVTEKYFEELGKVVTDLLEYSGFAHCPGEIMASNPEWNLPLSKWKKKFHHWISVPDEKSLMHASIFFDFRLVYGNVQLEQTLREYIGEEIGKHAGFLNFFAHNACIHPPPLSFFRQFIVEKNGEHKDQLDIKKRGMLPLIDAARVLYYAHDHTGRGKTNTLERFQFLAEKEPQNAAIYEAAIRSFEIFLRLRAINGLNHNDSGRYIDILGLNKFDRKLLKYAFGVIREVQEILTARFSLQVFR